MPADANLRTWAPRLQSCRGEVSSVCIFPGTVKKIAMAVAWHKVKKTGKPLQSTPFQHFCYCPKPLMWSCHVPTASSSDAVRLNWEPLGLLFEEAIDTLRRSCLLQARFLAYDAVIGLALLCFERARENTWMLRDSLFIFRFFAKGIHWKLTTHSTAYLYAFWTKTLSNKNSYIGLFIWHLLNVAMVLSLKYKLFYVHFLYD